MMFLICFQSVLHSQGKTNGLEVKKTAAQTDDVITGVLFVVLSVDWFIPFLFPFFLGGGGGHISRSSTYFHF